VIIVGLGCFFIWFAYDFYDDFMSGVYKNQGSVEFMKDIYGIQVGIFGSYFSIHGNTMSTHISVARGLKGYSLGTQKTRTITWS
jgi:hypothetical protein